MESCTFISAEEAWESFREEVFDGDLSETFGDDNPLEKSSSFEIFLADVTKQKELVSYIDSLNFDIIYVTTFLYITKTIPSGKREPISPMIIPSTINGARIKKKCIKTERCETLR